MAYEITITLDKELPEAQAAYVKAKPGKALARETDKLDSAARRKGVAPITSLLSECQAELIARLREEGFDPAKMRVPPEVWFNPADGVKTCEALTAYVTANLNDFKQPNPILRDLNAAEALLTAAVGAGAKFHLTKRNP